MKHILIFLSLIAIFLYSPVFRWEFEIFLVDVFVLIGGSLYILYGLAKRRFSLNTTQRQIVFLFILFSLAYSAGGGFKAPIYGLKQLLIVMCFVLLVWQIKTISLHNMNRLICGFFEVFVILSCLIYIGLWSDPSLDKTFFVRRIGFPSIEIGDIFALQGSSSILIGTFSVISFLFFQLQQEKKIRIKIFKFTSLAMIILSGTRASYLALAFGVILIAYQQGKRKFIVSLLVLSGIVFIGYYMFYGVFRARIEDEGSNLARVQLYQAAFTMFQESPLVGKGANS